jgi:redox-sensing transcriptional repressor
MSGTGRIETGNGASRLPRNGGRVRGPTTLRSRLAEVFLTAAQAAAAGRRTLTSEELSRHAGHSSTQVRRDLQAIGAAGTRGVGYDVRQLLGRLEALPGLRSRAVALVDGSGFGRALRESALLARLGLSFDVVFEPEMAGGPAASVNGDTEVLPLSRLPEEVAARGIDVAVLATPPEALEEAYERLCSAGVRLVISFGEQLLERRRGVTVHYAHSVDRLLRSIALSAAPR